MMHDLVRGVLEEFAEAHQRGSRGDGEFQYWADENMQLLPDHNACQARYMRDKWKFDGLHRKKARAYMRDYNKRPERMAKRRQYEAARRKRLKEARLLPGG